MDQWIQIAMSREYEQLMDYDWFFFFISRRINNKKKKNVRRDVVGIPRRT